MSSGPIDDIAEFKGSAYCVGRAGMFAFRDTSGGGWISLMSRLPTGTTGMRALAVANGYLYMGTETGVFRSADGFNWAPCNEGLLAQTGVPENILPLRLLHNWGSRLLAGSVSGGGLSWARP